MNWDAVGAVGEVAGAFGVIVSLAYLALQIRQNTRSVRGAMYDSIVTSLVELSRPLTEDPALARIFERSLEDWDALSDADRSRLVHLLFSVFKVFENVFYQHRQGTLEEGLWVAWRNLVLSYFAHPGVRTWWEMRRGAFSADFAQFLEGSEIENLLPTPQEMIRLTAREAEIDRERRRRAKPRFSPPPPAGGEPSG